MRRLALLLALIAAPALAAPPGALEGAEGVASSVTGLDDYALPTGRFTRADQPVERFEGEVTREVWRLPGDRSTLFAIRAYEQALKAQDYEIAHRCDDRACGGFDFRFAAEILPEMRVDLGDFRFLAARKPGAAVGVLASRRAGALYVQVIAVQGAAPAALPEEGEVSPETAGVPERKPGDARLYALARRLTEVGHGVVEGIDFDPGTTKLTEGSSEALAQAAQLLAARPDLRFRVVGHTDNVGSLEGNMKVSKARAEAVADALAKFEGVERRQLTAHGVAYLAPRASNATEEGRALNRRVELVVE